MYVIRAGEVVLLRSGRRLHTLGAGDFFGEMSMLLDAPRSATAEAGVNGAELIEIARKNFDLILRENPNVVEALLRQMARRLHQANEWLIAQTAAPGSGENRLSNSARVSEEESVRAENQERERTP
jgi:CRP-like cAMP-binding protein